MFLIKKFDLLSPPITLFFKGEPQHPSIPSVILSVISYSLVLVATIYYFLGFINKDSPKAYFFTRYIEDAGYFPVNASSMFNYIQFIDKYDSTKLGFDFSVLRAVGVNSIYYEQYMDNPEVIETENHWIYGPCNYDSDIKGIEDLIDRNIYNNAACIREYYDKDKDKYFKTGEEGFIWPAVEKGCSNPESTFYGLIVQRCDKAPSGLMRDYLGPCSSTNDITDSIKKLSFKYQIIDHYADMLNYDMPFTKYFYEVSSAVTDGIYIINHLNFNPADMLTHNGLFFDNEVRELSYFFTQNEKHIMDEALFEKNRTTNGCLIGVYFWMQNTLHHYERNYDRFQDLLSDIGGISSIITTIGYYFNLLINHYIILLNTEELIIYRDEVNFGNMRKYIKKPTFLKKVNQMEYPPKKQQNKYPKKTKLLMLNNKEKEIENIDDYNKEDIYNINYDKTIQKNKNNGNNIIFSDNYQEKFEIESSKNSTTRKELNKNRVNNILKQNTEKETISNNLSIKDMDSKEYEKSKNSKNSISRGNDDNMSIKKKKFIWFKYIWYLISCETNDKNIRYYENIREIMISEENIIQNYLDIYQLLKLNGIPKKDIFNNIKKN